MQKTKRLIVFVKTPEPGKCKTRLMPFLSALEASEFYKSLVINCLNNLQSLTDTNIAIYVWPDINHLFIQSLGRNYSASLHTQQGHDLGHRMYHALQFSMQHYERCVLIGTDCPVLDSDYINQAFKALDEHDMVLGPAADGGYVLIGASKIDPVLFENIDWGSSQVLQQTLKNCDAADYKTHLLSTLWDIDTPQDYIKFQLHLNNTNREYNG